MKFSVTRRMLSLLLGVMVLFVTCPAHAAQCRHTDSRDYPQYGEALERRMEYPYWGDKSTHVAISYVSYISCPKLERGYIPHSVRLIEAGAFADWSKLALTVEAGSLGECYAIENLIPYTYSNGAMPSMRSALWIHDQFKIRGWLKSLKAWRRRGVLAGRYS